MRALSRLGAWVVDGLVCVDQLAHWWLGGWAYVWLDWERPNPDETISSWVGRHAEAGYRAALVAEAVIDALFFWQPGHCRREIGH